MSKCAFPGCAAPLGNRSKCTEWCGEHAKTMRKARVRRSPERQDYKRNGCGPPRQAQPKCRVCGGMPWARTNERQQEVQSGALKPVVGPDGRCLGCRLPYSPEPEQDRGTVLRSGASWALTV